MRSAKFFVMSDRGPLMSKLNSYSASGSSFPVFDGAVPFLCCVFLVVMCILCSHITTRNTQKRGKKKSNKMMIWTWLKKVNLGRKQAQGRDQGRHPPSVLCVGLITPRGRLCCNITDRNTRSKEIRETDKPCVESVGRHSNLIRHTSSTWSTNTQASHSNVISVN